MKTIIITSPVPLKDEAVICNALFAHGLELLHLRKPGASKEVYEQFICWIEPRYRNRVVIHEHYDLAVQYRLHGIHLRSGMIKANLSQPVYGSLSISCHSLEEIRRIPFKADYCFLSPIFDSISKPGYRSSFTTLPDLRKIPVPVIAMGGITPENTGICRQAGFAGVAALGYIWEKTGEAVNRFIRLKTPAVMSIAGFDPSGGAGINADLKTFETTGSYGLGICSAITCQNEKEYHSTHWIGQEDIQHQYRLLFEHHRPEYIKIGLLENFSLLDRLTADLHAHLPNVKIIWDPILKASAGKVFHRDGFEQLFPLLKRIYLLTPNRDEIHQLFGPESTPESIQRLCQDYHFNLLWKGGHEAGDFSCDRLITPGKIFYFPVLRSAYGKHGTGCVLSAAITSYLAQGTSLPEACNKAQLYVSGFIDSNDSNLGYHSIARAATSDKPPLSGLHLQYITAPDPRLSLAEQVESVCRGGMRWVQLRMKEADVAELLEEGKRIKEICRRYHSLLIINDHVMVARQLNADGVHLGKEDADPREAREILGPGKIIGATCNTWKDILLRQQQQVDYIGLGPFAFTTTKEKLSPLLGLAGYRQILRQMEENHIPIPVFAIGGITENDIPPLLQTGIQGIALSGLIRNSPDLSAKTKEIIYLLNQTYQNQIL